MKRNLSVLLLAGLLMLILGALIIIKSNAQIRQQSRSTTSNPDVKEFRASGVLDFSVQIPIGYEVEENAPIVNFRQGDKLITLVRNTAAYDTLKEELEDYDAKNKLKNISENRQLEINGYKANTRIELRGNGPVQKVYYIYVDNWLYIISTKSESAYSDLDQIAQSFRYTP